MALQMDYMILRNIDNCLHVQWYVHLMGGVWRTPDCSAALSDFGLHADN